MSEILKTHALSKIFDDGTEQIHVLNQVNMAIFAGDRIAITGPSGSGKSTLLHLLGGLEKPTQGHVEVMGTNWFELSEKKRCQLRNRHFGFVYQFHHLLPEFTAFENVAMPLLLAGRKPSEIQDQVHLTLKSVGLTNRETHKPGHLSGGERQRVAIARALIHAPDCVLADEPTGNLDTQTASHVFDLMLELNHERKTALVIVTHDQRLADKLDRQFTLIDGQLVEK
jgi:lipoprotein-releasing system ATP-binding protein